jgi:hypothetical protein
MWKTKFIFFEAFRFNLMSELLSEHQMEGERITRIRSFTWLIVGIFLSKSVQLNKIGLKIPGEAREVSVVRRLSRFLRNPGMGVRAVYEPIVKLWIRDLLAKQGYMLLIMDATRVGFGHQLLMVAAAYHRRSLPIAWVWVKGKKGHSSVSQQVELLNYVHRLTPGSSPVKLVGDSEFRSPELYKLLKSWRWQYALRVMDSFQIRKTLQESWQPIANLVTKPGQRLWLERVYLTLEHQYRTNFLIYWKKGEKAPWLLATNFPTRCTTLNAYKRRMWIEEMFGDWKGHGFDFESTHVHHADRLSILTLAVALLYLWLVFDGVKRIHSSECIFVDRSDRCDLSIFQIGLRWIERCLKNDVPFSLSFLLPRWKTVR